MTAKLAFLAAFGLIIMLSTIAAADQTFGDTASAPAAVILQSTSHGDNWQDCDGAYLLTSYMVNGKAAFVNEEKKRFLAYQGNSKGKWSVAHIAYFDGVIQDQTDFSAYHHGGDSSSPVGDWPEYNVRAIDLYALAFQSRQTFDARASAGVYELSSKLTDAGMPVYINSQKQKFLTRYSNGWTIDNLSNLAAVRKDIGAVQLTQFLTTGDPDPTTGWYDYTVGTSRFGTLIVESEVWEGTFVVSGARNRQPVYREQFWQRDIYWNGGNAQRWQLKGVAGVLSENPDVSNGTSWEPNPVDIWINYKAVEGSTTGIRICEDACAEVGGRSLDGSEKCFFTTDEVLSWEEAERWCQQHAGELATISSAEENDLVVAMFNDLEPSSPSWEGYWRMWMGINDLDAEGTFAWRDGTPVGYLRWHPDEPNDFNGEEDCGEVRMWNQDWNDNLCSKPQPFMCAKPYRPLPATWKRVFQIGNHEGTVFNFYEGGDNVFHLSARPNEGVHGQVVLNDRAASETYWGPDVRFDVSFPATQDFEVYVAEDGWHISYGNEWSYVYPHQAARTGDEAYRAFFYVEPTQCAMA